MKIDSSLVLYEQYFKRSNRIISLRLKNGSKLTGVIVGFYKGDQEINEPFIVQWHLVDPKDEHTLGIDFLGFLIGQMILHSDILEIEFQDDHSILYIN